MSGRSSGAGVTCARGSRERSSPDGPPIGSAFVAAYLLVHGIVKLAIVVALLIGSRRVYPWAIAALIAFPLDWPFKHEFLLHYRQELLEHQDLRD
ncbi:hypothetical protein AB4Y87_24565 [Paenarthrobacter sp. RAF54_2]|uniref:hypothetical protein n=1 Tax=Paenarthrobacter sp. RAF54_2 TaxID=3233061 RepID=UPI003F9E4848